MDKLKYIPGDLVMTNGVPLGSAKDVVYRVTSSDPSKTLKLDDGTVVLNGWKLHKHHERNSYDDVSWSSYHKPAETNISLRFYQEEKAFFLFLYAQEISETPIRYIHQLQHLLYGLGINHEMEV